MTGRAIHRDLLSVLRHQKSNIRKEKHMLNKFRKSQKGFTLIELLIVVAIIGILAAVAIPQFAAYRVRGYNSSALSDLRNFKTAQESLWADSQCYGMVDGGNQAAAVLLQAAAPGAGIQVAQGPLSPASMDNATPGARIAGVNAAGATGVIPVGVGNGVNTHVAVIATAAGHYNTYVMATRHENGDTAYGADSENGVSIYRVSNSQWVGVMDTVLPAAVPAATVTADNFGPSNTIPGGGAPTANWTVM
jgi:prepilin-type N-terminal cleavage/methylation domain-containing protein